VNLTLSENLSNHESGIPLMSRRLSDQEAQFRAPFTLLEEAIRAKAFPACSTAITWRGELIALKALGRFTYEPGSRAPTPDTIFDLASLTKIIATTSMAMILYERGLLDLEASVAAIIPEFAESTVEDAEIRRTITPRMLLAHSPGLPAYERLFLRCNTRDELLQAAFRTQLASPPGTHAAYSDIGFIILGVLLERAADESLDSFCQREIFGPLSMTRTTFNPASALKESIPPTADDRTFRHRVIQGEVQDENASTLGGVAGHAGLFSTAEDLATFAQVLLAGKTPLFRPSTIEHFTRRELLPAGTSRALGWDTPSRPSQSGKYFSPRSVGHLGYTGTSLWIDLDRELSITLLSNRTWPDCKNESIKKIRPAFHDAVMEALGVGS
jgi:serine-type D-Ala-D-Ala carboxypeptidase